MKILFSIILAGCTFSAFSQTSIIAHKSHNGTSADFAFADPANYGGPPLYTKRLVRINDTVIDAQMGGMGPDRLLIINHEALLDSVRNEVRDTAVWIDDWQYLMGRDTTAEIVPIAPNADAREKLEELKKERLTNEKKPSPVKSEPREGSLPVLGVILFLAATLGFLRNRILRA